jgi:hypothetical protein
MISVLNSAQSAFESAGVDAEQYPALAGLLRDADILMFLLLLPPPLLLLYNTVCAVCSAGDGVELVVVEDNRLNERRRHEKERAQLLAENGLALAEKEQQLAAKDAEKEQQLAAKDAEKEQQLAAKDAEKEQQLAAKDVEIERLLAEMASPGCKKSSKGAGAAGAGTTKKVRQQYSTVEQPIQR